MTSAHSILAQREVNGKLVSKSLIKSGKSERGEWRIIEFVIQRTYNKKKIKVAFIASGKNADLVNNIEYNERISWPELLANLFHTFQDIDDKYLFQRVMKKEGITLNKNV